MKPKDGTWMFIVLILLGLAVLIFITYSTLDRPAGNGVVPYANVNR